MDSEEIWQEGSRIVVDYFNQRISITSIGDFDRAKALRARRFIFEIFDESPFQFDLLVDVSREGKQGLGTRKVWKEINAHPKVRFVALCGVRTVAKIIHTIIIGFKKHPRLRMFTSREAALQWVSALYYDVRNWFDTKKDQFPQNRQVVVLSVQGVNYIGRFEKAKKIFRIEDELKETLFSADKVQIYWRVYEDQRPGQIKSLLVT